MPSSSTIIAALKFEGGVVIAADSQVSDSVARVRWPVEKLEPIRNHPLVVGFSGSLGVARRARSTLNERIEHPNMVNRLDRLGSSLQQYLSPYYDEIRSQNRDVSPWHADFWTINLHGLVICWADDAPAIIELEMNGDRCPHEYFHAVGSGSNTAYAVYKTLGGSMLTQLDERKAIWALLRILRTSVNIEMSLVSGPFSAWVISNGNVRKISEEERDAQMELIEAWEKKSLQLLLEA